jgi:hypothetical protein
VGVNVVDVAVEMAMQLLHMRDDSCIDHFEQLRVASMVALVVAQPLSVGVYVACYYTRGHGAAVVVAAALCHN